jgi:hypothetical protein
MPFPLSRHSVHAYILVHEGCGRIKLFFYAGNFSRDAFVAHVPPILNFKKRGIRRGRGKLVVERHSILDRLYFHL